MKHLSRGHVVMVRNHSWTCPLAHHGILHVVLKLTSSNVAKANATTQVTTHDETSVYISMTDSFLHAFSQSIL